MADNASQSIKDLQSRLEALDKQLFITNKNFDLLGKTISESMNNGITTINDLYSKLKAKDIVKMKVIVEKKQIEEAVSHLEKAIGKDGVSQIKIGDQLIRGKEQMRSALAEYQAMLKQLPKSAAEAYDYVMKIVNSVSGKGKDNKGTALGQERAKYLKEIRLTTEKIKKLQDEIAEKQNKLGGYKEHSKNWEKTKKDIEESSKELQKYKDKLAGLQGKTVKDEGAAALRRQEENFINLNKLLNRRRELLAKIRQIEKQGGDTKNLIAERKALNTAIQTTINKIRQEEDAHKGVTAAARQNTLYQRQHATNASLERTNKLLKEQKTTLNGMIPTLQRLASAFGIAFSVRGLVQFGRKLVDTRKEFEMQQISLRAILQNKQLADEIWDKTMKAALQSPFKAMQLTKYTKQLAAYRIETEKLFETTKRLADVSAGLGVDMQRLILAYGQVKAANYLRASEIRQFTEAGVNILGELRDYFNDVKGMSVTTAQVMDMVQKRLVGFSDVEAIFKRMTEQGGIFYNMQEVQSKTVKGQINKLHDAYDQMLNSIGKANQGTLKNFVSLLNNIVKNWRSWAVVLKSIGWGVAIGYVSKFAFALWGVNKATVATLRGMVKLKWAIQGIGKAFMANLPMLAVGAVAGLIAAMVNLDKKMRQVNHDIDEQNLRLYETRQNFADIKSKIEANNATISSGSASQEELNKAQTENKNILIKLNEEYPELSQKMKITTNGIIEMNGAIDENIRKLNEQMTIQNAMKQSNWFSDSDQENLSEFEGELSTMKTTLMSAQLAAETFVMNMEMAGRQGEENYRIMKAVSEIDLSGNILDAVKQFKEYNKEFRRANPASRLQATGTADLYRLLGINPLDLQANWSYNRFVDVIQKNNAALRSSYINGIKDNAEFMEIVNTQYGGKIMEFVAKENEMINKATIEGLSQANSVLMKVLPAQSAEMKNLLNWILNKIWGTGGIDYFATSTKGNNNNNETPEEKQAKIDAAWRRRISLLEEMKKRYDELSKSAYGYAKSEKTVRDAFDDFINEKGIKEEGSFSKIFKGTGITMDMIDFTSMEGMMKSMRVALQQAKGISDAVKEEIMKKIDSYEAQITIDARVRIREDFARQMEKAFDDYDITLELDKLNLPKGLANDLWGVQKTDLSDLRAVLSEMYTGLLDENGQLNKDAFADYKKYLEKIDDLEKKQQRERLKEYSKYLEAQYSERAKLEMEYVRKLAGLEATTMDETKKKDIREGLRREFEEKSKKQDWEDFKGSDFYVEMMEDLEKQGSASLDVMKRKLLEMRDNAENLSPRALKEVVKALEKIDDIERSRNKPLERLNKAAAELYGKNMKDVYESLAADQGKLATYEEEEKELERIIMLEEERAKLNKPTESLEQTKILLESAKEGFKVAKKALDEFKSSGSKEDEKVLADLMKNFNKAAMDVEIYQLAVAAFAEEGVIGSQEGKSIFAGMSIADLKAVREELKKQKKELQGEIDKQEDLVRVNKELLLAWDATWEATKKWAQSIHGVFDGVMDTMDYFEESTDTLNASWKEFGDASVSALTDLVSGIQAYQDANAAAEKAGLATGLFTANGLQLAMAVLGVIIKMVQAVAKMNDSKVDLRIERLKEKVDDLADAYGRLEKSIEKTYDAVSYMKDYNEMTQNLYEQIEKANEQIAAAQDYKDKDKQKEVVDSANDAIQEAEDKLDELKQKQIEVFGGIGEDAYRSAAEGFVEAWKSAFLETGDGLQGLQDHFDEFLNDWFVKQATIRVTGKMLEPMFRQIDQAVDQYGAGGTDVLYQELQNIREKFGVIAPELSKALESIAGTFGLDGEGSLSGLAAGIQGMTEEQANILEAYWNSVRGYTANIDMNVAAILGILSAGGSSGARSGGISGGLDYNPQLQQLQLIAANTSSISALLQSVSKSGHTMGGAGIKVFLN